MKKKFKILLAILLLVLVILFFYRAVFQKILRKYRFENSTVQMSEDTKNSPFSITKIITYSSAYGENQNTNFQQSNWILNLFQYTDMAIYIGRLDEALTDSNSVKKLWLENIHITSPKLGMPALYYLDSLNFGTSTIDKNYEITDSLEFTVLNDANKNNNIQSNTPVFFTDCSNPITLKYVNRNIKENYKITSQEPVFFNGKLLKMANIALDDLAVNLAFTIQIQTNDDKQYFYQLSLPICLENRNKTVYDGGLLMENKYENYSFMEKCRW